MTELHGLWSAAALLALVAVALIAQVRYRRVRGAWPDVAGAPAEFKPAIRAYLIGAAVLTAPSRCSPCSPVVSWRRP
ncbi:hypothetical protein [Saccharopolyspora gregorii]|uniref:hypothetical protein n=1 Tax=Saccharopolyspora gregorii TaxID=33914 RepID=UPI0031F1481A